MLIEKLSQDIARQKAFDCSGSEDNWDVQLNTDISQLLAQYDAKLSLKRNVLLTSLSENHEEENAKLQESFQRKDDQHLSLFKNLERQVSPHWPIPLCLIYLLTCLSFAQLPGGPCLVSYLIFATLLGRVIIAGL